MKIEILQNQIRTNASSKILSLFDSSQAFMIEMQENMAKYRKSRFQSSLIKIVLSNNFHHRQFSRLLVVLNLFTVILVSKNNYVVIQKSYNPQTHNEEFILNYLVDNQLAIYFSEVLLLIVSIMTLICQLFFRMNIYIKQANHNKKYTNVLGLYYEVFWKKDIFQFILHFLLSVLGIIIDPIFYYIQSFCFIYISKTMYSVLEALKLRWVQFLGILIFILQIVNLYSYIGYIRFTTTFEQEVVIHFQNDIMEQEYLCDSPFHCFLSITSLGLRDGGGLGAWGDKESYHKSTDYYPRFIFDFSFYLIVTLIMTNMIYGVVVDSFAELRDHHQKIDYDIQNVCIICSGEKWQFEKKGQSFEDHIKITHNIWSYSSFLIHLNLIGRQNMNGTETYIYDKVKSKDNSWIPQVG